MPATIASHAMVAGICSSDAGGDLPALLRDRAAGWKRRRQDRDAIAATAQARFTARIVLVLPSAPPAGGVRPPGALAGCARTLSRLVDLLRTVLQVVALVAVRRLTRNVVR